MSLKLLQPQYVKCVNFAYLSCDDSIPDWAQSLKMGWMGSNDQPAAHCGQSR